MRTDMVVPSTSIDYSTQPLTGHDLSLVMTCHWSSAICHLARWKRWAFILL